MKFRHDCGIKGYFIRHADLFCVRAAPPDRCLSQLLHRLSACARLAARAAQSKLRRVFVVRSTIDMKMRIVLAVGAALLLTIVPAEAKRAKGKRTSVGSKASSAPEK